MSVSASALVALNDVKTHFAIDKGDKQEDALLNNLIPQLSAAVEKWCNRTFAIQLYNDILEGTGEPALIVRNAPVRIYRATGDLTLGSAVVTNLSVHMPNLPGMPAMGTGVPAETTIVSVDSETQATLSKAATATGTGVSLTFGLAVWLDSSAWWGDSPEAFASATALTLWNDYAIRIDQPDGSSRSGLLYRNSGRWHRPITRIAGSLTAMPGIAGNVKAVYSGGFATVPYDVQLAVLSGIGRVRQGAEYGAAIRSFNYRGYSPQLEGVEGGFLTKDIQRLLWPYRATWRLG